MGKILIEDISFGRTQDWPAIPEGLYRGEPSSHSTSVVCSLCGSPWGGLIYVSGTDTFRHRLPCPQARFS